MEGLILGSLQGAGCLSPVVGGLLVYALLYPEKVEKWSAMLWRAATCLGGVFRGAHKRYVLHDLQGRVNEFARTLERDAPFLASKKLRVEWVDEGMSRKAFLDADKVVLRLRRDDPEQVNFCHGAYLFVSASLLWNVKRYVSPSQKEAVDLYVATTLFEREKPGVLAHFLDEYLHPRTADGASKTATYLDKFAKIDSGGLFYPVLLQELDFLGSKVFGKRRDDKIIADVDSLVDFLEPIATRRIGEDGDLTLEREYCRCAVVIVGKSFKVTPEGETYVSFIKKSLVPNNTETVYVIGLRENKDVVDNICEAVSDVYERHRSRTADVRLRYGEEEVKRSQYLVVLRMRDLAVFQPSE